MICSLRFYFRHPSEHFDIRAALDGLDSLSQMLSLPYAHYSCTVYFDDDKRVGDAFSFPAGETGKARLLNALEHLYASKNDDKPVCVFRHIKKTNQQGLVSTM